MRTIAAVWVVMAIPFTTVLAQETHDWRYLTGSPSIAKIQDPTELRSYRLCTVGDWSASNSGFPEAAENWMTSVIIPDPGSDSKRRAAAISELYGLMQMGVGGCDFTAFPFHYEEAANFPEVSELLEIRALTASR